MYDIHEDTPRQVADSYKKSMGSIVAKAAELVVKMSENSVIKKSALVFTATDYIYELVKKHNKNIYTVKNYPKSDDICCSNNDLKERDNIYCYSGRISEDRGVSILVKNSDAIKGKFLLAGVFDDMYKSELQKNT